MEGVEIGKATLENKLAFVIQFVHAKHQCPGNSTPKKLAHRCTGMVLALPFFKPVRWHHVKRYHSLLGEEQRSETNGNLGRALLLLLTLAPREPTLGHEIHKMSTSYIVCVNNQATFTTLTLWFPTFLRNGNKKLRMYHCSPLTF